jgi:hypothetical protein
MIGGPQNLYNLFSQFPRDYYVILTCANVIDPRSAATGSWLPAALLVAQKEYALT